jgi:phospholipid/cholesterol/gamma-HCH transport system permease protein
MFPVIVIFSNAVGIAAGMVTAVYLLPMSPQEFIRGLRLFFEPFDITYSLIKTTSFGFLITVVGCYQGFATAGGAEGVGVATTRSVVISSMLILLFDAFWAVVLLQP